jgi:hypothetical protein
MMDAGEAGVRPCGRWGTVSGKSWRLGCMVAGAGIAGRE